MAFEWTHDGTRYRLSDDGFEFNPTGIWEAAVGDEDIFNTGLMKAVAMLEVYRKSLEPYAKEFARRRRQGKEFIAVDIGFEVDSPDGEAIAATCHLMGIPLPGDEQKDGDDGGG